MKSVGDGKKAGEIGELYEIKLEFKDYFYLPKDK